MAEYIRFVSYLYEYNGNEKKKNVGFVRYEVRCGQKKLMVVVSKSRCREEKLSVYAFYRELDSCIGIRLGDILVKGGRGSFQYSTYAPGPSCEDDECSFEKVAGIMVMGENGTPVYATVWDDEAFLVSSFLRSRQELICIDNTIKVPEAVSTKVPDEQKTIETDEAPDGQRTGDADETPKSISEAESEPETAPATLIADNKESPEGPSEVHAEKKSYELYRQTMWDNLCKIYPKVMPFPYNVSMRALRIRPGDIGRLPKENWPLAKNSFILHAFFQYRYIIVVKIPAQSEEYEERYMLGVPGVFSQMDSYLAQMFGFHEFFGSPREKYENGAFGFWMQEITMENQHENDKTRAL